MLPTGHTTDTRHQVPGPLSGLTSFGKHVAGGFSKLSDTIFPWLSDDETPGDSEPVVTDQHLYDERLVARSQHTGDILSEASNTRYAHYDYDNNLPLLPPLFIPPPVQAPEQPAALASDTVYHRAAVPQYPADVPQYPADDSGRYYDNVRPPQYPPPGHNPYITVYPPAPPEAPPKVSYSEDINEIPDRPLHLLITPLLKAAFRRKKQIINRDLPSLFGFGAKKHQKVESPATNYIVKPGFSVPVKPNDVMYYLPSPDLSSGREIARTADRSYSPRVTKLLPGDYFEDTSNEILDKESINYAENEANFKDAEDAGLTTAIDLSPTDTIIVDLSDIDEIYETADEAYNEVVETEDELEALAAITDSSDFESKKVDDEVVNY